MYDDLFNSTENKHNEEFAANSCFIGRINPRQIYLDASSRGIRNFDLPAFINEFQWKQLTHLYLARNKLLRLPDELFYQLQNLEWLDLRWNELGAFPTTIDSHQNIKTILLQDNYIGRLPIELGSLPNLKRLSITNNPLEFPSKKVILRVKNNEGLIDYLRLCWREHSTDVCPPKASRGEVKKKLRKSLAPAKKFKDHTEVICKLRSSGMIKDQMTADNMLQALELEQKLVQSIKDDDVLKKWRDAYKESQGLPARKRGRDWPTKIEIIGNSEQKKSTPPAYYPKNVDSAIDDLRHQLSTLSSVEVSNDPSKVTERKAQEIKKIKTIQNMIASLKHRC